MRKFHRSVVAVLMALAIAGPDMAEASERSGRGTRFDQPVLAGPIDQALFDQAVLTFANEVRARHGRPPLRPDPGLSRAATDHARNMAKLRMHSHRLPVAGQERLAQRLQRHAVRYRGAAENIALGKAFRLLGRPIQARTERCRFTFADTGQPVPQHTYATLARETVQRWMESPRHRDALLDPTYNRHGSAMALDLDAPGCGDIYMAQNFAG